MNEVSLLLPDFLLIALGALLVRTHALSRSLWDSVEKLVYLVLFPALLFGAITRNPVSLQAATPLAGITLAVLVLGMALALGLRALPRVDGLLHASGAQTAFRFNSYVALAIAERLAGGPGLAWMALVVAVAVPVANVGAVWPLARQGGQGLVRELARNPLILATVAGLLFNATGLNLPAIAHTTLHRLGAAALPLGLMAVGAGLQMGALRLAPVLAAALLGIRHLVLPAFALLLLWQSGLARPQQAVLMAFASLPTASTAYVLAVRMGGNGPYTAGLVTVSTLLGMVTLPLWLWLWRAVAPAA
jgi:malonate transporter and related proteins